MFREQKKLDINLKPWLKVTWDRTLYLKNIWITNSLANSAKVVVSDVRIKIAYLEGRLTIINIISKPEENKTFLMKFIDIGFYSYWVL